MNDLTDSECRQLLSSLADKQAVQKASRERMVQVLSSHLKLFRDDVEESDVEYRLAQLEVER